MNHFSNLFQKTKDILGQELDSNEAIVLGVSGGPDSMALLSIVQKHWSENKRDSKNIHVVSCDHNTRLETKQEVVFVKKKSKNNTFKSFLYSGGAKDEQSLRERRHQCFIDYCHTHDISKILTGHHLDDRIEGTILNLSRGAGTKGILSITTSDPHFLDSTITLLRPLLEWPKKTILQYCKEESIDYISDPSNFDSSTSKRNLLRHFLQENLLNSSRHKSFQQLYQLLEKEIPHKSFQTKEDNKVYTIIEQKDFDLVSLTTGERTPDLLYKIYNHYGISIDPRSTTLENLSQQLNKHSGNKITYQGLTISAYRYASTIKQ